MSPERLHEVIGAALAIPAAAYIIALVMVLPQADVKSPDYFGLVMIGIGAFSFSCGYLGYRLLVRLGARELHRAETTGCRREPQA